MIEAPQDVIKDALDRLARTPDGLLLYRYLQRECLRVLGDPAQKRALPVLEGRRSFAAELMAYMAEGIGENDRACVVLHRIARTSSGSERASSAGRRRVTLDESDVNPVDALIAEYNERSAGNAGNGSSGNGEAT